MIYIIPGHQINSKVGLCANMGPFLMSEVMASHDVRSEVRLGRQFCMI